MLLRIKISDQGFTITELLVAVLISGIVMTGIYSTYYSQQKSYVTQTEVAAMQQNLRAGMYYMEREIRMAGYDPTGNANAGIVTADSSSIRFTEDLNGDGDTNDSNEDMTYSLYDSGGDGDNDLGRKVGGGSNQPVAENIDALNFVYLDQDGNATTTLSQIRSIQISMVVRSDRVDQKYINNTVYRNQQGTVIYTAPGDSYRRDLLTAQIKCRNLGLQ